MGILMEEDVAGTTLEKFTAGGGVKRDDVETRG